MAGLERYFGASSMPRHTNWRHREQIGGEFYTTPARGNVRSSLSPAVRECSANRNETRIGRKAVNRNRTRIDKCINNTQGRPVFRTSPLAARYGRSSPRQWGRQRSSYGHPHGPETTADTSHKPVWPLNTVSKHYSVLK